MKHRNDIDGLRALAVVPVVLYHAGMPGVAGGFVGVDIFFVISGYLITSIIHSDVVAGRFSLLDFYERRVRRILPALFVMLLFVMVAAPFVLLPSELRNLPSTAFGAILFVSNVVFWRQSGYFATVAAEKPLLHTWSLGIEEQFYIFMPVLLFLLVRYAPRFVRTTIFGCAVISFALCLMFTVPKAEAAFFLLPTRAWELLAGSLLALGAVPAIGSAVARDVAAGAGLLLILAAVTLIGADAAFPGYLALAPVVGAALLIHSGPATTVARVLSSRPLVLIGLFSYSLYLWHWPLLVYATKLGVTRTAVGTTFVVALSVAAAVVSWRLVEAPFRHRERVPLRVLVPAASSAAVLLLAGGVALQLSNGWPSRFPSQVLAFDRSREDVSPMRARCHRAEGSRVAAAKSCVFGHGPAEVAVWGDSHGVELSYALASGGMPVMSITASACAPVVGYAVPSVPGCAEHNRDVLHYLDSSPIGTIVLAVHYDRNAANPAFMAALKHTTLSLVEAGKRVILMGPEPDPGVDVPSYLARSGAHTFARADYEKREAAAIHALQDFGSGVTVLWPADYLCPAGQCLLERNGAALYFDDQHISMHGASIVAQGVLTSGALAPSPLSRVTGLGTHAPSGFAAVAPDHQCPGSSDCHEH